MTSDLRAILLWMLAEFLEDQFFFWGLDHRRRSYVHRLMVWQERFWWLVWQKIMDAAASSARTKLCREKIVDYWIVTVGG